MTEEELDTTEERSLLESRGWRIIFRYLLEYKKPMLLIIVLGIISALANASVPYLVGKFFDALINNTATYTLLDYVLPLWGFVLLIWFGIQVIANSVDWVIMIKRRRIGVHVNAIYPARAAAHLLRLPISFHKDHKIGETWDKIARAGNQLSQIMTNVVISVMPQLLSVAVGILFAFSIQPLLASVLLLGVMIYVISLIKIVPPLVKLQVVGNKAWNKAYGIAYDAVTNYDTVKQASAEEFQKNVIDEAFLEGAFTSWFKVRKIQANIDFFQRAVVVFTQLGLFALSTTFVFSGAITIGELIALNGYALIVFGPFITLGMNWQVIQNGVISIERAEDVLDMPEENDDDDHKVALTDVPGAVTFENVFFCYSEKEDNILKGVSFKVKPGERVAFVGETGVGKSTAISLISAYYFANEGTVSIDGTDVKDIKIDSLRKNIAVVPQEVALFNDTISNNIKFGRPDASDDEIKNAAQRAHADIFIDKFSKKYDQLVGERGVKLSVGQKQRIAIARAILRDPKILILDEPTSALDPKVERLITESLEKLMEGRTTFIIAHRLSTVRKTDRIYVFEKGRIVEEGAHEDLLKIENGVYRHLHNLHIGLHE